MKKATLRLPNLSVSATPPWLNRCLSTKMEDAVLWLSTEGLDSAFHSKEQAGLVNRFEANIVQRIVKEFLTVS